VYSTFLSGPQCLQTYHEATMKVREDVSETSQVLTKPRLAKLPALIWPESPSMHFRGLPFVPPRSWVELRPVGGSVNHMAGCWLADKLIAECAS
jgi:hypothetical protein